jgi:hypothetical protein
MVARVDWSPVYDGLVVRSGEEGRRVTYSTGYNLEGVGLLNILIYGSRLAR